jgi:hypothetical protein
VPEIVEAVATRAPERVDALRRALQEFDCGIVVNMARTDEDAKVGAIVQQVCERYLGFTPTLFGTVPCDADVERWASRMDPTVFAQSQSEGALAATYQVAYRMLQPRVRTTPQTPVPATTVTQRAA